MPLINLAIFPVPNAKVLDHNSNLKNEYSNRKSLNEYK